MVLTLTAILSSTGAQAMLKYGVDRAAGIYLFEGHVLASMENALTEPYILGGAGLILLAFPMWLEVLARLPLSIAYPLVSLGFIVSMVIGAFVMNESVMPLRISGVGLIIVGAVVLSRSQQTGFRSDMTAAPRSPQEIF